MNDEFVRNIISLYGNTGKKWLSSIPTIIKTYEQKWDLKVLPSFQLSYNYVALVIRRDGTQAVIKIGFPDDTEFKNEINALEVFHGEGVNKLIQVDRTNAVILLEMIQPGIPLSTINDDSKATKIIAGLIKKIRKPLPKNHRFISIQNWIRELQEYPQKYSDAYNPPIPLPIINKALELFDKLISTSDTPVLVHGDLHHDNILSSEKDGWVAIDPKGIAAEPAYETAAMIRNPYNRLKDIHNLEEVLLNRIIILSKELGYNPKRIHAWCLAQTILSGVWSIDQKEFKNYALRIAQALEHIQIY